MCRSGCAELYPGWGAAGTFVLGFGMRLGSGGVRVGGRAGLRQGAHHAGLSPGGGVELTEER